MPVLKYMFKYGYGIYLREACAHVDLWRGREAVGGLLGTLRLGGQRRRLRRAGLAALARSAPLPGRGVRAAALAAR